MEQWKRQKYSETNPNIYKNLVHENGDISDQQGKGRLFTKWCQDT